MARTELADEWDDYLAEQMKDPDFAYHYGRAEGFHEARPMPDEPMPEHIATILLRALTWCGSQITQDEREAGWKWVEDQRGNVEEMGT